MGFGPSILPAGSALGGRACIGFLGPETNSHTRFDTRWRKLHLTRPSSGSWAAGAYHLPKNTGVVLPQMGPLLRTLHLARSADEAHGVPLRRWSEPRCPSEQGAPKTMVIRSGR